MGSLARRLWIAIAAAIVVAACGSPAPSVSPVAPSPATTLPSPNASAATSAAAPTPTPRPTTSVVSDVPIASSGSIAMLGHDGSLSIIDAGGRSHLLADASGGVYGFPTWSPDGTKIATVRSTQSAAALVVFDTDSSGALPAEPRVIFDRSTAAPFYLFWTPDSKSVTFLATEGGDLSLRIAPADGSAPLDGSGPGAVVRSGNPFYYDWIGRDRLFAHIGVGTDAFLGEMRLDGDAVGNRIGHPGDFRSAVVSRGAKSIAYVRDGGAGPSAIVVAARDGSGQHSMDVFGSAAIQFDPGGTTLAAIGPTKREGAVNIPLGPLRLMDVRSGKVRTLVDGSVGIFWWSPDGATVAAVRIQPVSTVSIGPSPSPTEPSNEIRLLFVDVASGKVTSQPVVQLGASFVNGYVAYFDQYALSHHLWAPDGSSILLPEIDETGTAHVSVRYADGRDPIVLDGEIAFWSP
jgi:hypothetical protein